MQVWTNDNYVAALHRVLKRTTKQDSALHISIILAGMQLLSPLKRLHCQIHINHLLGKNIYKEE